MANAIRSDAVMVSGFVAPKARGHWAKHALPLRENASLGTPGAMNGVSTELSNRAYAIRPYATKLQLNNRVQHAVPLRENTSWARWAQEWRPYRIVSVMPDLIGHPFLRAVR